MFQKLKQYGWIIGSCLVGVVILFVTTKAEPKKSVIVNETNAKELIEEDPVMEEYAIVDVKGQVNDPGVYEVALTSRVDDVITLAGGFTEEADDTQVNKAQKIHDEMVIYVPAVDDQYQADHAVNGADDLIRINYATTDEITELPGIGPSKADAIIQYREENGPFTNVDELLHVSGIGEKTLEQIKQYIQIP